ncbi:MAG: hypothetical protein D6714_05140 [Bacteroidetes bacterium]|nr:MAG: hypothetical protein D6714_05140 [Bacteroidota bacterium]
MCSISAKYTFREIAFYETSPFTSTIPLTMKYPLRHSGLNRYLPRLILGLFLLLCQQSAQAQYWEIGSYVGTSTYVGDLSEQKFRGNLHAMLGVLGRYNFTEKLSVKGSFTKGTVSGDDGKSKFESVRMRNLNFRSDILELAVTGEYSLTPFHVRADKKSSPYLFAGLSAFYFNPQAQFKGEWYDLHDLKTENKSYRRLQVAVPFGIGFRFNVSYQVNFGFEFGARKTFTDYLDDVSTVYPDIVLMERRDVVAAMLSYRTPQYTGVVTENPVGTPRGNPANKDWYFFAGATVTVNLTDKYGLDYDEKYEPFKDHLKKPPKSEREKKVKKRHKKRKYQLRLQRKKKRQMSPATKKRTQ